MKLRLPNAEQREMLVLTADQAAELSDTVGVFYRAHILTAAQTGCDGENSLGYQSKT